MFERICIFTLANEDEIAFVELIEEGMAKPVEDYYASQGFSVHVECPEIDPELQLLQFLS